MPLLFRRGCLRWRRGSIGLVLLALLWAALTSTAAAQDGFVPVYNPEMQIFRAVGPIEVDGQLGDAGWARAATVGNFAEHSPGDQTKPEVDTEVLVAYDDDHLYLAWICYDDPRAVRASFCERDEIFSDDYVILCLDTYGESSHAYEIAANPYGIPGDLLFSSANGEDISYDMIFESAGRINHDGWVVEMAIPFTSIRFPKQQEQVWRMDFWRNRPREYRYQYSWAAYDRDEDCWPCQWGTVKGVSGVTSGAGLEMLPSVVAHQSGAVRDDGHFTSDKIDGDVGLGVAYHFSSELRAEAAINPDFSQVESDVAQIDVNTTFALFYPERRPFFQEGSDLFETYFNAVYTRSINDPLAAGKVTWRRGANRVAVLSARDEHSVIILPFEESSQFIENGTSTSNILRARHDFGNQSHIGMIATDRRFESGGSGSLLGVDGRIRLSSKDAFRFQFLGTHTEEVFAPSLADSAFNVTPFDGHRYTAGLDGETFYGHGAYAGLNRSARSYWLGADYWERSPTFRADNGFEPSNSIRQGGASVGGIVRFENSKLLENINGDVNVAQKYNFDHIKKDEWVNASMQLKLRTAQTSIHPSYMRSNELFGGIQFNDIWQTHICTSMQPRGALQYGGYYNHGHRIARYQLVMGKEIAYGLWADLRPIDRLLLSFSYDYTNSDDLITGDNLFSQAVFRSRLALQVSRELSARLILQYNDRYNSWDVDPLITYRINPFSIFYIGSTNDFRDLNPLDDGRNGWTLTSRQYYLKLQWLFRL
jgi:hypothetical protein